MNHKIEGKTDNTQLMKKSLVLLKCKVLRRAYKSRRLNFIIIQLNAFRMS